MNRTRERGFTLIELMVVIVLIGLLAGAVGVGVFGILTKGEKTVVKNQITSFEAAISLYRLDHGRLPETLDDLTNLQEGAQEPYLTGGDVPLDPWGEAYLYDPRGGTKKMFLITSKGQDLTEGTEDDITNENMNEKTEK